uniref:Uncharacterized protein n=1 Tax=viral metagenome TaxID=1070528 RepID=A0A6C0IBS3_9ZZZZ
MADKVRYLQTLPVAKLPSELAVKEAFSPPCQTLQVTVGHLQKRLQGTCAPCQTPPVALPPSELVVKRLKAPCQTPPVALPPSELVVKRLKAPCQC